MRFAGRGTSHLENFTRGTIDPIMRLGRAGLGFATGQARPWASTFAPAASRMQTLGRRAAGLGLGLTGLGYASQYLQGQVGKTVDENIARVYGEGMPVVQQDMAGFMDRYMASRGMLNEEGQFDPTVSLNRGGVLGGLSRGADDVFRSLGVDPARMSPLQKLMVLGGATGAGARGREPPPSQRDGRS